MDPMSSTQEARGLEINWIRSIGSALGAVSAAVLLSTVGAAGTLAGAAIGSLCVTIGGAIYSHSLELTRSRMSGGQTNGRSRHSTDLPPAAQNEGATSSAPSSSMLRGLPWKRIVLSSGALFIVVVAVILAFESSTGRAVSSFTGGTSDSGAGVSTFIPGVDGGTASTDDPQQQEEPETTTPDQNEEPVPAPTPTDVPPSDQPPVPSDQPTPAGPQDAPAPLPDDVPAPQQ